MKIGYLVPEFPSQTHAFFWREALAIEETGTEVRLLSTRRPSPEACPHTFRDKAVGRTHYLFPPALAAFITLLFRPSLALKGMRYIARLSETPVARRAHLAVLLPVAAELLNVCWREDIRHLHIHSCANAAHLGSLLRILGGPSYSLTLHGDLPVYGTDHGAKMARAIFVSAVTRPLAAQIAKIAPELRNPVACMGVDCDEFSPPNPPRQRAGDDPLKVITVARLNRTKGHSYTLQAVARLVNEGFDVRYRIVGSGPEEAEIRAEIDCLGISDRVEMTGALGHDRVQAAMAEAHVMTLTSFGTGEAAPVTVMEAMASGLPVIVSKIGGTADMIANGLDGYLVPQRDVPAITNAMRVLASNPEHAQIIGKAARVKALASFDFRMNAKKLLQEIYKSVQD